MVRKNNRDEFSAAVKNALCLRAGTHCSNPQCRKATTGPTTDPTKVGNVGQAAHICAAASGPGAARYDPVMTPEERSSINNGIWLCQICARLIDVDPLKYPVELLQQWKRAAEDAAERERGHAPLCPREFALMKTALFKSPIGRSVSTVVADIARLSIHELEAKDPRFSVNVEYIAGVTRIAICAKEPVAMRATVDADFLPEFRAQMTGLIEHGQTVQFNTSRVRFAGSALLEELNDLSGVLKLETQLRRRALVKMLLVDPATAEMFALDDFLGEVVGGTQSITFDGVTFEEVYSLRFRFDLANRGKQSVVTFEFAQDYDRWIGRDVHDLPYFDKVFQFVEAINNGWTVKWALEVEGKAVLSGLEKDIGASESFWAEHSKLAYLRAVRDLARLWSLKLTMQGTPVSGDEAIKVLKLWSLLFQCPKRRGTELRARVMKVKPESDAEVDNLRAAVESAQTIPVFLEQPFSHSFDFLGTPVSVGPMRISYSLVSLKLTNARSVIRRGSLVTLRMTPAPECEIQVEPKDASGPVYCM